MDRNNLIGTLLLGLLLIAFFYVQRPSAEQQKEQQRIADSLRQEQILADSSNNVISQTAALQEVEAVPDSVQQKRLKDRYGSFADVMHGEEKEVRIENDKMEVVFTNKGGRIKEVWLKNHFKWQKQDTSKTYEKVPLKLLDDEKNKFEYILPIASQRGQASTAEFFFTPKKISNGIEFTAAVPGGGKIVQTYAFSEREFDMDYSVDFSGTGQLLRSNEPIRLRWVNRLKKLEKNATYEATMSTVYYHTDDDAEHCSCTGSDEENVEDPIRWVANTQQFFTSALISKNQQFKKGNFSTITVDDLKESGDHLKTVIADLELPDGDKHEFSFFIGPNKFNLLKSYDIELESVVPFGWSIFGTINRYVIRPLFNFFFNILGNAGIAILVLTVIVKLVLYPLTYKMLHSSAKMAALKPEIAKLKEKVGDDQQKLSMEQMKLYRTTGVNPLGGCMPMVLQMPIWFALYRFFPASFEFRQRSFLWADDLSAFDSIYNFGDIGIISSIYGDHISLFTILWAATTILYTWYNMKYTGMGMQMGGGGANMKMMKYMQYAMPVMFLVFFNNYASGLTCYLFFSNVFNIAQTFLTKEYILDNEKIRSQLESNKAKPKKKGKFQERLEQALKEQQAKTAQKDKKGGKSKKKK